jgi:hypothetical protein
MLAHRGAKLHYNRSCSAMIQKRNESPKWNDEPNLPRASGFGVVMGVFDALAERASRMLPIA